MLDSPKLSMLNSRAMKKSDLLRVYKTLDAIGEVFAPVNDGVPLTRSAVSQWDEEIPGLRQYQIRELVPDIEKRIAQAKRQEARA